MDTVIIDAPGLDAPSLDDVPAFDALDAGPDVADAPVPEADAPDAPLPPCTTDADCQLVPVCERGFRCAPGNPLADERGCVDLGPPAACPDGWVCDSEMGGCVCVDGDADGVLPPICGGRDCDDANPMAPGPRPSAVDVCDGFDNDCDRIIDEDPERLLYRDLDGDGVGTGSPIVGCSAAGFVPLSGDCDDADPLEYPGAPEICNRLADGCQTEVPYEEDLDRDGYAPIDATCRDDVPGALQHLDCWDWSDGLAPGRPELCNGIDDDCDPSTADGSAPDNGCLPGHRCMDGACRQTVSLGASEGRACALLTDGTIRCWGSSAECGLDCFTPLPAVGGGHFTYMDPNAYFAVDGGGVVWNVYLAFSYELPPGTVAGNECVARRTDGVLECRDGADRPGPTDIVEIGYSFVRTRSGELWTNAPVPALVLSGVTAMSPNGEYLLMTDGTVRQRDTRTGSFDAVPGISGATEVAYHYGSVWVLRGAEPGLRVRLGFGAGPAEPMVGSEGARGIVAGYDFACAITADGRVRCWAEPESSEPDLTPLGLPERWPYESPHTIGGL